MTVDLDEFDVEPGTELDLPGATHKPIVVKAHTDRMTREEWLDARRAGVGGSDLPTLAGISNYGSEYEVYQSKVTSLNDEAGEAAELGHLLEPVLGDLFSTRTGLPVLDPKVLVQHPEYPFMLANPDRLVILPTGRYAILEIKTRSAYFSQHWRYGVPVEVELQVRHYMEVLGLRTAFVAVLIGGQQFKHFRIERSPEIAERIIALEAEFWQRVVDRDPPAPTHVDSDLVGGLFVPERDRAATVGPEVLELLRERKRIKEAESAAKDRLLEIDTIVKSRIGDAEIARDMTGRDVATWKAPRSGSGRVDTSAMTAAFPALADRFRTGRSTSRTLRVDKTLR